MLLEADGSCGLTYSSAERSGEVGGEGGGGE
jgi:hypothetical protein